MLKGKLIDIFIIEQSIGSTHGEVANQILSEVEKVFKECLPEKIKEEPKANVVKRSHIEIHNKLLEEIKQNFKKLL